MEKQQAKELGVPVLKKVVDLLASRQYAALSEVVSFRQGWTPALVEEALEGFLTLNELEGIDPYGVPLTARERERFQYEYEQLHIFPYRDGSGFHLDYDLTSCKGELNDLTLLMTFETDENGVLVAYLEDLHVM